MIESELGLSCSPKEHNDRADCVRREDLPEKEREFEDNVGDVEYRQKPLILT